MSQSSNSVSKNAFTPQWREPFTGAGVRLTRVAGTGAMPVFDVLEVGEMTLGREWSYRSVCSPFWRIYQNASPGAAVRVGRQRFDLAADRPLVLPPGVEFDCVPAVGVLHLWAHFSVSQAGLPPREPIVVRPSQTTKATAEELQRSIARPLEADAIRHCANAWLHAVWARAGERLAPASQPRLDRVLREIRENVTTPPDVKTLAGLTGLAPSAFSRWFKNLTGSSPAGFVRRERIVAACRLLRYTDLSIEQIAAATGFTNRYHFTRVFSEQAGTGPSAFRREGRGFGASKV